jgi:F420-dependent oxidoreductase-like protein
VARIAAANPAVRTLDESVNRAREAERLGYESVWVTQMPDARDASLVLQAYAAATQWVRLGTAVLPIYTRHPTAMVQMAASLDEISQGRFILGLGVSHKVTVESMWGLRLEHPVEAMREYMTIVRSSLRDGSASFDAKQFSAHWSYSGPRRSELPIMISALGPLMLELAGEISDGVVLWMCAPDYIRDTVIPHLKAGRAKAGKTMEGFEVVAMVPVCVTNDRAAGLEVLRQTVERYANLPFYRRALDSGGFAEELAAGKISEAMLDQLGGVGDEGRIREAVRRYREAGTTLPCVGPFSGHPGAAGFVATLEAAATS